MKTVETRVIDTLQPHPRNTALYGNDHGNFDEKLVESLQVGIWPGEIQVTTGNIIISGHRRCEHAIFANIQSAEVWVRKDLPEDPTSPEVLEALLQANLQRSKSNEQKLREFALWKEVEQQLAKGRMLSGKAAEEPSGEKHLEVKTGQARDLAAKRVGIGSGSDAEKAHKALLAADKAEASGDAELVTQAKLVKKALEKGIAAATRVAKEVGLTDPPQPRSEPAPAAQTKTPPRPTHLRKTLDNHTPYLQSRLLVAAQHLAEAHRIIKQEQQRFGTIWERDNIVFTTHFQEVVAYWNERGVFEDFAKVFDDPSIKTYDDVMQKMVQLFKRASERTEGIRTFTGCKPDHNKAHLFAPQ